MIITRTPFRISYVGGGTDFPDYFLGQGGAVLSTAINKYVYITVTEKFDGKLHVRYSQTECVDKASDIKHPLFREALLLSSVEKGVEMVSISDIPGKGSGLGSSSAFSVGLLNALFTFKGTNLNPEELARKAIELEIDKCGAKIGFQDQYASAYGDLNHIQFRSEHLFKPEVIVTPMRKSAQYEKVKWLEESTMLFYLGMGRDGNKILSKHNDRISSKDKANQILDMQKYLVKEFMEWLESPNTDPKYMEYAGELVSNSWGYKKRMTPEATNDEIDYFIAQILSCGACGAKVCGAGNGGFLMIICDQEHQHKVRAKAVFNNLHELKFNFCRCGSQVIYKNGCSP